jgi:hypothetical protein
LPLDSVQDSLGLLLWDKNFPAWLIVFEVWNLSHATADRVIANAQTVSQFFDSETIFIVQ